MESVATAGHISKSEYVTPTGTIPLLLVDPTYTPKSTYNAFERFALSLINDPRDLPFIKLSLLLTLVVGSCTSYFFLASRFNWWVAAAYLFLIVSTLLGPFILMLHNTSHRPLFKMRYRKLGTFIPWVLGPFFGESPETYYVHHVGMHHPENNLESDLSCTMAYQRDSFLHFMRYFGRFFVAIIPELAIYMWKRRRLKLFRRLLVGELSYYAMIAALLFVNWRATLVVFVAPMLITRFSMMAGNWGQHAFIDQAEPGNCYRNSITCINSLYNLQCFNDGYHIGHHLKQTRHWTDMPTDFESNRELYAREGAIVFEGLDFFVVWLLLMVKRYDVLAKHIVPLDGVTRSEESLVQLLKSRTRRFASAPQT